MKRKILHIINGLHVGGAEMMLYKLVVHLSKQDYENEVISLIGEGEIGRRLIAAGVKVQVFNFKNPLLWPLSFLKLSSYLKKYSPDIVHCWLLQSNIAGGLTARLFSKAKIIWGIRSDYPSSLHNFSLFQKLTYYVGKRLSFVLPDLILCVSQRAKNTFAEAGFASEKMRVIHNGFDLDYWKRRNDDKTLLRKELKIEKDISLIGMVANYEPIKNHRLFLSAAGEIIERRQNVRFILCGQGVSWENAELVEMVTREKLESHIYLLNLRYPIRDVYHALDVFTLTSHSEGFPNVVGEAMACAIPCVVTDVGDMRNIIDGNGYVVPNCNPWALVKAWECLLDLCSEERCIIGMRGQKAVGDKYGMEKIGLKYHKVYSDLLV